MTQKAYLGTAFIPERYRPEHKMRISSVDDVLELEQRYPFYNTLKEFEQKAKQPFETVPFAQKQPLILGRLNELVRIMRINPVWKERLNKVGVTKVKDLSDWRKIPIATRDDLNALYTRTKDGLVIPWQFNGDSNGHKVIASGGSSGEPIITVYRTQELRDIGKRAGQFWIRNIMGQNPKKSIILNLFNNTNGWASNELVQNILEGTGANTIPVGEITLHGVADFFLKQGVTDIAGLPSNLAHLVQLIKKGFPDASYPQVQRAVYGGEFIDPIIREQLKKLFPNIKLISVYSSTQSDHIAVQVGNEETLRLTDDINFLEIVDENGQPLPDGEVGRIIVTRLMGNGDQALRLDLQDKGSISLPDPNDPLRARKLALYGREGDYLRMSTRDVKAKDLINNSHKLLTQVTSSIDIQSRQVIVDESGVHLKIAVSDPSRYKQLDNSIQFQIMREAIMQSTTRETGFFEDPKDWDLPPSIKLTITFVKMDDLEKTPAGKIHPFVNKRGENKK